VSIKIISKIADRVTDYMPKGTVSSERANQAISWIGRKISSPQNRLILGATALMSQPFIDLNNRKVDEETRKVSAARTVAKIIAGTSVGFVVRSACNKFLDYVTLLPDKITKSTKFPKLRTLFTPEAAITGALEDLNQYKKAWGAILALEAMVFTNFLIDAPLTKYLTNKFVDKIKKNQDVKPPQKNSNMEVKA